MAKECAVSLAFVVPIAPRRVFSNEKQWQRNIHLLQRTIASVLQQESQNWRLIIVSEENLGVAPMERVEYIVTDVPQTAGSQLEDWDMGLSNRYDENYASAMFNKAFKLMIGCRRGKELNVDYLMCLDSDDLVHKSLVSYVENEEKCSGWRIEKGYIWRDGSAFIEKCEQLHNVNGSTHIVSAHLVDIPSFDSRKLSDYSLFESHGYLAKRLKIEKSAELSAVPFRAILVVKHQQNRSNNLYAVRFPLLKYVGKILLRGRLFTKSRRSMFMAH